MSFAEFKLTQAGRKLTQELGERAAELVKGGKSTPEQVIAKIQSDKDLAGFLNGGFQKYRASFPGVSVEEAVRQYAIGVASELPEAMRKDTKAITSIARTVREALVPNPPPKVNADGQVHLVPGGRSDATPPLQPAAKDPAKKPTGVIDALLNDPDALGKIGGAGVSRVLRQYKTTLDNIIESGKTRGINQLADAERVGIRAAYGAFVKESAETGIKEAQARANFLDALGKDFAKGSDNRRAIEGIVGKQETAPKAAKPQQTAPERVEPKFDEPPTQSSADHSQSSAEKVLKAMGPDDIKLLAAQLDTAGRARKLVKIDNLNDNFDRLELTLKQNNLIDFDGERSLLSIADVVKRVNKGQTVTAPDLQAMRNHFTAYHGSDIPHPSSAQQMTHPAANMKGVATSEAIGAVKESLQKSKQLEHVKDYLGEDGYKSVRKQYESWFQRNKWPILGSAFVTLGSLIAQATDSTSDKYDDTLGWGARIEYNLTKMITGLPGVGGWVANKIKSQQSDNPVIQALQGSLNETEKRKTEAGRDLAQATQEQNMAELAKAAQQSVIDAANSVGKGGGSAPASRQSASTGFTSSDRDLRFKDLLDPLMSPLTNSEVAKLKESWDARAGTDGVLSVEEQQLVDRDIEEAGLDSEKKAIAKSFLLGPRLGS